MTKNGKLSGTVKWFDTTKGYGFIERPGDKDVFVHVKDVRSSGIDDDLQEGDSVQFELAPVAGKGPKATNIRLVKAAA